MIEVSPGSGFRPTFCRPAPRPYYPYVWIEKCRDYFLVCTVHLESFMLLIPSAIISVAFIRNGLL